MMVFNIQEPCSNAPVFEIKAAYKSDRISFEGKTKESKKIKKEEELNEKEINRWKLENEFDSD